MSTDLHSLDQERKTDEAVRQILTDAFLGDQDAVRLFLDIVRISHVWDDLIDKDVPVTDDRLNGAFTSALIGMNLNAFFRQHAGLITPVLLAGLLNWHAANDLEKDGRRHCLEVSNVIRCSVGDVAHVMAFACGGMTHAIRWASALRMLVQQESLDSYIQSLGGGHEAA